MQTQTTGLIALLGLAVALAPTPTDAQSTTRRIDGGSPASFEASVALLQNELSARRREDFDVALAVIWVGNTVDSDFDGDGDVDLADIRLLEQDADDLLTDIRRGNVVSAIEERAERGDDYTATDYFKQLDGLGYAEVLALAGRPSAEAHQTAERRDRVQALCRRPPSGLLSKWCGRFSDGPPVLTVKTGRVLNTAMQALNAQKFADARAALARLNLEGLHSYERSKVEQVLFAIANGEAKPAEAREHLLEALAAGGLNPQETANVLDQLRVVDAQLSDNAP